MASDKVIEELRADDLKARTSHLRNSHGPLQLSSALGGAIIAHPFLFAQRGNRVALNLYKPYDPVLHEWRFGITG